MLAQSSFVEHSANVPAFGLPGTGKTHSLCALEYRLVETGHSVLFAPTYYLVQSLPLRPQGASWTTWATSPRACPVPDT